MNVLSQFVISVIFCDKTVGFCNKNPDAFCNRLLSHFVIISVAFYYKLSKLMKY